MQSHVADHFYVSITQLLIKLDKKVEHWNVECRLSWFGDCCLLSQFTASFYSPDISSLYERSNKRDESLKHILLKKKRKSRFNETWHMMEEWGNPDHLITWLAVRQNCMETESHAVCFAVCNLVFFLTKPNVVAHAVFSVCYD